MINYQGIYTDLYKQGYHEDREQSHAKHLAQWLKTNYEFGSVLDIGCSRGWTLRYFSDKKAMGIDISEVAVKSCQEEGLNALLFDASEVETLDWKVDLVISTDTLEHLSTEDAIKACRGIRKIARKYIAVKIPSTLDRDHWKHAAGMNLHLTVQPISWWKTHLVEDGDQCIEPLPDCLFIKRKVKGEQRGKEVQLPSYIDARHFNDNGKGGGC